MTGYNTILKIRRLEERCLKLGFMLCHTKHCQSHEFGDVVALKPKDIDSLPIYSRDAELFVGTLEELEYWLRGVEWSRQYDEMLKVSNSKKREDKEQLVRNRRLFSILKDEKVKEVDA
jgi:hypothetical protein